MGADLAAFIPAAITAGGEGAISGISARDEHDRTRQMMALAQAREGREAQLFPEQLTAARNENATFPLRKEGLELGVRGGRAVGQLYGEKLGQPAEMDRDAAEFLYRMQKEKELAYARIRAQEAAREADDQIAYARLNAQMMQSQVADAETAAKQAQVDVATARTAAKGLFGEQKKDADDKIAVLEGHARAANAATKRLRIQQAEAHNIYRSTYKQRYGKDPGGITPEAIAPQTGILAPYQPPAQPQGGTAR